MNDDQELERLKGKKMKELLSSPSQPPIHVAGKLVRVDSSSFETVVLRSRIPIVVDFWADWCGPCSMIAPHIERLAGKYAGHVSFAKLNVDENPELASRFDVLSIPTLIFFNNGHVVDRLVGTMPYGAIEQRVQRLIAP